MLKHALALIAAAAVMSGCAPQAPTAAPPADAGRAVVEQLFAAFNRHDIPAMAALYAPDAVLTSPDYCQPRHGPEGVTQVYTDLFAAVPNLQDEVLEYVVEGDRVAVKFVAHSTTPGRTFDLPIATFLEVRDGLIVRDESYFNTGGQPCTP